MTRKAGDASLETRGGRPPGEDVIRSHVYKCSPSEHAEHGEPPYERVRLIHVVSPKVSCVANSLPNRQLKASHLPVVEAMYIQTNRYETTPARSNR